MLFLLLLFSVIVQCQYEGITTKIPNVNFRGLYLQITGKLRGFQELGHAWSLMVGREGFEPLSIYVEDVNRLIAEECAKGDDPRVPLSKQ